MIGEDDENKDLWIQKREKYSYHDTPSNSPPPLRRIRLFVTARPPRCTVREIDAVRACESNLEARFSNDVCCCDAWLWTQ